jgi:ribosome biogenesis GTPase
MKGVVTKSTGSWYHVRTEDGRVWQCRIKGKFRIQGIKSTNPVAVGDFVDIEIEDESISQAVIYNLYNRENYIVRKSINLSKQTHIIAANLDQAILVATLANPRTSFGFIDRFLVTAEAYHIPTIIVFNKIDLLDQEDIGYLLEIKKMYENIGYKVMLCSTITLDGIDNIRDIVKDKNTLISGHSGVGKSSLINLLLPNANLRTSEISDYSSKGVHTTTFAEMYDLPNGGTIIDTPGIRELGVFDLKDELISHYFPEMRIELKNCKFNNCMHINEPGCAIKKAVDENRISLIRYESYLSILAKEDNRR